MSYKVLTQVYLLVLIASNVTYAYHAIKLRNRFGRSNKLMWSYLIITLLTEIIASTFFERENLIVFNGYIFLFVPIILAYQRSISESLRNQVFLAGGLVYLLFAGINFFFLQGPNNLNTYSIIVGALITTPFLLYYLYSRLNRPEIIIYKSCHFYNVIGFLVLFVGNFLFFSWHNYIFQNKELFIISNLILQINNILTYSLFLIGALWVKPITK